MYGEDSFIHSISAFPFIIDSSNFPPQCMRCHIYIQSSLLLHSENRQEPENETVTKVTEVLLSLS